MHPLSSFLRPLTHLQFQYRDVSDQHQAKGLVRMVWGSAIGTALGFIYMLTDFSSKNAVFTIGDLPIGITKVSYFLILLTSIVCLVLVMRQLNRGKLSRASRLFVAEMFVAAVLGYATTQLTSFVLVAFSLPVVAAGVLLSRRSAFMVVAAIVLTVAGLIALDQADAMPRIIGVGEPFTIEVIIFGAIIFGIDTIILHVFAGGQQVLLKQNLALMQELRTANVLANEANRLKSEFLSTMSHELRTPLNAIIGFTDLMLTEKPGTVTAMQRTFLERVAENNRRLKRLIDDILDLSRIEAGRMELHITSYSPREMVEHVSKQMSSLFAQKQLAFRTSVSPAIPDTVTGDRDRVEQAVINLLSNAVKFTDTGEVELSVTPVNNMWRISVRDTGPGIAPHMQDIIFEPFRQIDGTHTRRAGGSGLGLAITQELCRVMNGTISVESEPGKGSTFNITLPMGTTSEKHTETASTQPVPAAA